MTVLAHLLSRHLDPDRYHCVVDEEGNTATFYTFNLSGKLNGFQQYRPGATKEPNNCPRNGRYFTYGSPAERVVWGMETFYFRKDVLFVTEGIFDAVRLHNLGLPAIAVFTCNPKDMLNWFGMLPRKIVFVADDDKAGVFFTKLGYECLVSNGGKDLGDMTDEQVRELVQDYL